MLIKYTRKEKKSTDFFFKCAMFLPEISYPKTATPGCILGFPLEPGFLQGVCVHPAVSRGPEGQGLINQMPMLDTM